MNAVPNQYTVHDTDDGKLCICYNGKIVSCSGFGMRHLADAFDWVANTVHIHSRANNTYGAVAHGEESV